MGIAQFFRWFETNFSTTISKIKTKNRLFEIDNLLVDMNGIIHTSAQKIYKYGEKKTSTCESFLRQRAPEKTTQNVFEDIESSLDFLIETVRPRKRLYLAIDGPAPRCKLNQQRQRRFKNGASNTETTKPPEFDPNQISPGTEFMDRLSLYITKYIMEKMKHDPAWKRVEVIFSDDKVPGEGEAKLMSYLRVEIKPNERTCIYGNDADLIMLALTSHFDYMYVLRDNTFGNLDYERYILVDIGMSATLIQAIMNWGDDNYDERQAINDFVFICFTLGNDFVPHVPSLEIIENGIDKALAVLRNVGRVHGHVTEERTPRVIQFKKEALKLFFQIIADNEKMNLEEKHSRRAMYFEDPILSSCVTHKYNSGEDELDIGEYRQRYMSEHFTSDIGAQRCVCLDYLTGLQFVLTYYTSGIECWNWSYNSCYAPFAHHLALCMNDYDHVKFRAGSKAVHPFEQLLYILPPSSYNLLPRPLNQLYKKTTLGHMFPVKIITDLSGKRREWQGIVLLPKVDKVVLHKSYMASVRCVDAKHLNRNIVGKNKHYTLDKTTRRIREIMKN